MGLTFASSIPAAVISMALMRALMRALKTLTIWENNIVQTVASAAGTLSSIIFVLPGLVMVGWWTGAFALIVLRLYLWTERKSRDFPLLVAD